MGVGKHAKRPPRSRAALIAGLLTLTFAFGGAIFAPAWALTSQGGGSSASPSPSPSPSETTPTPTPSNSPDPEPDPSPSGNRTPPPSHLGGDPQPSAPSPAPPGGPVGVGAQTGSHDRHGQNGTGGNGSQSRHSKDRRRGRKGSASSRQQQISAYRHAYNPEPGSYASNVLVAMAQRMQAQGWSASRIDHEIYAPFILAGAASWVDTWHALRYGPGSIVRLHEGQDVFCKYGTPVLATQDGTIEFGNDSLGGRVARLHRSDGSYFYYAHLSGWNIKQFSSGDHVQAGDVIGFCGNSGDASGGPPHVHFGWYGADGNAIDPMRMLVGWLHAAEKRVASLHGGAPTSKEVAAVPLPGTGAPSTVVTGFTPPLIPGVTVSADVAAVPERPAPDRGDPPDAAPVVLWMLLAVPPFLPGARRA
jgi:hypothetical protein